MTFNSLQFAAFFAVVLAVYFRFRTVRGQNLLVIVAGSVFYAFFDWRFLFLLYFSVLVDFFVGRALGATEEKRRRRRLVAISLVAQLGILAAFKYYDFFVDSAADFLGQLGWEVSPPLLEVLLPVGISFYTFQTLAYILTIHRGRLQPETDIVNFAAFVMWFPQMVAGPIEQPKHLLAQIQQRRERPDGQLIESGLGLIVQGLVKKVVIADSVARVVNTVYSQPGRTSAPMLVVASVGFAVQVYGDFSGYSDIARGTSRLLGVELRRNFEQPFLARDMQELWKRWHTSLGWWFTEFVGVPLNKLRKGVAWQAFVTLVIFALIGLWHGPSWNFVIWGSLNGLLVAWWQRRPAPKDQDPEQVRLVEAPRVLLTFGLFVLGAVFFRAASFGDAITVLGRIATLQGTDVVIADALVVAVMTTLVFALDLAERRRRVKALEGRMRTALGGVSKPYEAVTEGLTATLAPRYAGAIVGLAIAGLIIYSGATPVPFIYFQF